MTDINLYEPRGVKGYWYRKGRPSNIPYEWKICPGCQVKHLGRVSRAGFCTYSCAMKNRDYLLEEDHPMWAGNEIKFRAMHLRLRRQK